jgi:hypothetical protein
LDELWPRLITIERTSLNVNGEGTIRTSADATSAKKRRKTGSFVMSLGGEEALGAGEGREVEKRRG